MNQTVSVRIPEHLHMELVAIKEREGISIISMLETAIDDYLESREDVRRAEERREEEMSHWAED